MFEVSGDSSGKSMVFTAELDNIDLADQQTRLFLEEQGLSRLNFTVLLCMREALANAVLHGSSNSSSKQIRYEIRVVDSLLILEIEDQGEGFDWRKHPQTMPAPESTGGRGLAIMKEFFSSVHFNDKGNHLILTMDIPRGTEMSDIKREGENAVIAPGKDIVASMADSFREELKTLVQDGVKGLSIDLTGVQMMDSIGMGLLIATHNSLKNNGGQLKILNANVDILGLFKTMRLDKHFEIVEAA